jgi:N-acetylglucosamine-6-phosphate deacetylase
MRRVELGDRIVAPGCVDVHVHGGAGCQVNGDSAVEVEGALAAMASFHAWNGTSSLLATTVSDSPERLAAAVAGVAQATARARATAVPTGARIIGSHLEGPFIAPTRAGAQDPSAIRPPDRAELNRLLELGAGTVRMVTLAPELPGADELIADCLDAGAVVALGHTEADFDTARRAFDAGATHVTHLFNCMPPLHHRLPGLITAALVDDRVTVELICDLHHVHPAVVEFVAQIALERLVLVTDAGPVAGTGPGRRRLGHMAVELTGSRVTLATDPTTLAGSALTMSAAVRNFSTAAKVPLAAARAAASATPASIVAGAASVPPGLGRIEAGAPADLMVLDPALSPVATVVGGAVAFDPGRLLS